MSSILSMLKNCCKFITKKKFLLKFEYGISDGLIKDYPIKTEFEGQK